MPGAYTAIKTTRTDIQIITGEKLVEYLQAIYDILSYDTMEKVAEFSIRKPYRRLEIVYYDNAAYWLIVFHNDTYSILEHTGKLLDKHQALLLSPMIDAAEAVGSYVDLNEEAEAVNAASLRENIFFRS